jgi:hypothetical protein
MSKPSVEQFERKHTQLCNDDRLESAHVILVQFRSLYNHEIRSDIYVYMAHERMRERQYWLSVSRRTLPVRF